MAPHVDTPKPGNTDVREGQVLGSYELLRLIGEGSMGRVFQARHQRLGREVALKVLRAEHARNSALVVRFFEEARTVNRISHAHIVEVFDFVEDLDSGQVFCVMELLRGHSLAQRLREGPLPLALACHVGRQLCSALAAAHAVGVVHRDLKPDNIFLLDRAGGLPDVKVLDFGVAKLLTGPRSVSTLDGTLVGTPLYMSPEQAAGLETDRRADLYAVGNILYEMLSGRPPFADAAFGQLMVHIITTPAPPLPARTAGGEEIPPALARLVMRCLEKDASSRPRCAEEVLAVLEGPLADVHAYRRARRRELTAAVAGGVGLLGTVMAAALALASAVRAPPQGAPIPSPSAAGADTPLAWGSLEELLQSGELARPAPLLAVARRPGGAHDAAGGRGSAAPGGETQPMGEVVLTVHSEPAGALVTRADTGEWLGTTPLRRSVPGGPGFLQLRVSRPGRLAATRLVPLSEGGAVHLSVSLPAAPAAGRAPSSRPPRSRDDVLDPFAAP